VNTLNKALRDYISIRRNLGFRLRIPAGLLKNFVAFLQAEGASHITTELALRWATQPATAHPSTWAGRLGMVRGFATWLRATNLALKFHRQASSLIVIDAKLPTSIPTPRSNGSLPKRNSCLPPKDCAPEPLRRFSVYSP
jgi:hypothetical protein